MKATSKFFYTLFALVMVASLFACAPAATSTAAPVENTAVPAATDVPAATEAPSLLTADGRYPVKPVKICVETFDPADTQYMDVQDYFKFLSEKVFNVEFTYSEKIESAEQELQFIENCGAAGAKGFIAYYNVSKGQAVAKAAELGCISGVPPKNRKFTMLTRPIPTTWAALSMETAITMACTA